MEIPQVRIAYGEDAIDLTIRNTIEYPCILCKKPTSFRYGSIPLCERCAGLRRL